MRLSYLGKLPLFFTLGIDMRQFLLGTVQRITFERNCSVLRITKRQFLLGTVQRKMRRTRNLSNKECQFLLGTVQQQSFPAIINIVLYFFQKFNHFSSKKSVDLFSCLTLIISI